MWWIDKNAFHRCVLEVLCPARTATGQELPPPAAAALAKTMDVAVVFVATTSSEGSDRKSLNLDDNGNELVSAVAAANPNTVVVAATPGALLTPWRDAVKSILVNFMPGRARTALVLTDAISLTPDVSLSEEGGNAAANVLFGHVNPPGKRPLTYPTVDNQVVTVHTLATWGLPPPHC